MTLTCGVPEPVINDRGNVVNDAGQVKLVAYDHLPLGSLVSVQNQNKAYPQTMKWHGSDKNELLQTARISTLKVSLSDLITVQLSEVLHINNGAGIVASAFKSTIVLFCAFLMWLAFF